MWYSNYVFDAHVWEIYTTLIHGHTLHIINDQTRQDLHLLSLYIEKNHIDLATLPPALLDCETLVKLKTLIVAGDKTDKKIFDYYKNNSVNVINAYGPTEVTVCASFNRYHNNGATNIGSPITNAKCYVLDNHLMPLPVGALGELYIGGEGLRGGI